MFKKIIFIIIIIFSNSILKLSSVDMYFCTAADSKYFDYLVNLIGSIHKNNFDNLKEIAVFDIGMNKGELDHLSKIQKLKIYQVNLVHPDILKPFKTLNEGKMVPGWYAWKPVIIKQALDMFPQVLWIDSGSVVLKPLDDLFKHIKQNNYFLCTIGNATENGRYRNPVEWQTTQYLRKKFQIDTPDKNWILQQEPINASFIGVSKEALADLVLPLYEFAKDLRNFEDDGTTPGGFGTSRHDQSILALHVYTKGLRFLKQDYTQNNPMLLKVDNQEVPFYITWDSESVSDKTHIFHSRFDLRYTTQYKQFVRYKNV